MFLGLCVAMAGERLAELFWSRAHERRQARRGGRIVQEPLYAAMVAVHAGTLIGAAVESQARARRRRARVPGAVRFAALGALGAATALRVWTLATLGESWSTRVTRFDGDGRRVVVSGPYRYLRHPNYLAVIVELAALPLAGGAWMTALLATALNAAVLARRIPLEEVELAGDDRWWAAMRDKPRLLPSLRQLPRPWERA
jgi:methyltransferase